MLVSDGITNAMSDQEVVDLCRGIPDPTRAAAKIVSFAEDVGECVFSPFSSPLHLLSYTH